MASENRTVDASITKGIEERMEDLGVEDKATKKKGDGGGAPMEKKESDLQEKAEDKNNDKEEKEKAKEVKEVAVSSVDHRSYGGDEGKTEDVPTTVVHEIHPKQQTSSGGIFYTVGTKVLSTANTIKNAIIGKSNK